jgi:hypothetical protein
MISVELSFPLRKVWLIFLYSDIIYFKELRIYRYIPTYTYMQLNENMWVVLSTYRPIDIGSMELEILEYFANNISGSAYQIQKEFKTDLWKKEISYKNIHKRVKRLVDLNLIEKTQEHYKRSAIHYRITSLGMISYLDKQIPKDSNFIEHNKENILLKILLLDFFEEKSIESIFASAEFPSNSISSYLLDSCSTITRQCKNIWNKIKKYELEEILPESTIIQQYLSYIDSGKYSDDAFLQQIYLYERRLEKLKGIKDRKLLKKWNFDNKWYNLYIKKNFKLQEIREIPVFPLNVLYVEMLWLTLDLENKRKLLIFNLVSTIGETINLQTNKNKKERNLLRLNIEQHQHILDLLKDKKFKESVKKIRQNFVIGCNQLGLNIDIKMANNDNK